MIKIAIALGFFVVLSGAVRAQNINNSSDAVVIPMTSSDIRNGSSAVLVPMTASDQRISSSTILVVMTQITSVSTSRGFIVQ